MARVKSPSLHEPLHARSHVVDHLYYSLAIMSLIRDSRSLIALEVEVNHAVSTHLIVKPMCSHQLKTPLIEVNLCASSSKDFVLSFVKKGVDV